MHCQLSHAFLLLYERSCLLAKSKYQSFSFSPTLRSADLATIIYIVMDVSELKENSSAVTVHGVLVGEVSPVKTSKKGTDVKYFEGALSDGKKSVRVVSFDPKLRNQFEEAKKQHCGVALKNCVVKRKLQTDNFEILMNSKSSVVKSPKKFKVEEQDVVSPSHCSELGTLEEIKDLSEHQQVTVSGKIQSVCAPDKITIKSSGKQLLKQEFVIADCTFVCRGVAWEQHVGSLKADQTYKLVGVTIRSFNGLKYISIGEKSRIEYRDDIGEVIEDEVATGTGGLKTVNAEVVAVMGIDTYASCRNCNGKVVYRTEWCNRTMPKM